MITDCTKTNTGKLLAAVIAMLMVVCAVAVVATPSEGAATPYVPSETDKNLPFAETESVISYESGLYTLSDDATIDLTAEGNYGTSDKPMNIHFSLGNNVLTLKNTSTTAIDVYIHYVTQAAGNDTSASVVFFGTFDNTNYGGLVLDGKINMHVVLDKASTVTATPNNGNHIFMNADITLDNGAQLTLTQMAGVGGKTTYCSSAENLCTLTMDNGSNLVLDSANGIDYKADVSDSSITIQNPKKDTAFINLAKDSSIVDSTITSSTGADNGMALYIGADAAITGSTVNMGSADVVIVGGATATATDSTIVADEIKYRGTGVATIVDATITADFVNDTSVQTPATSPAFILNDVTLNGENVATGVVIGTQAESSLTVPAGSSFTSDSNLNMNGTLVNGGTVSAKIAIDGENSKIIAGPGSKTTGIEYSTSNQSKFEVYAGAEVTKAEDVEKITYAEKSTVSDFAGLQSLVAAGVETITVEGTLTVDKDFEIPYGTKVTVTEAAITTFAAGADDIIVVKSGSELTVSGELYADKNIYVEAGATLIIDERATVGKITLEAGTKTAAGGALENSGILNIKGAIEVREYATVENSGDMYLGAASIVNGTFENSGAVGISESAADVSKVEITGADGTFNNLSGGVVGFPVNTGTVTGVSYDVTMTTDITQSTTFGSLQNVIVPEGAVLTIQRTATLEINGTLTVLGTLNVEGQLIVKSAAGAQLIVDGTVNVNTTGNNQGKIVIGDASESGIATVNGTVNVTDGSAVEVAENSALVIDGTMTFQAGTTLTSGQQAPVAALEEIGNKDAVPARGIVVSAGATLTLNGDLINTVSIRNYGDIAVDNSASDAETPGSLKVLMGSADASVTLTSFRLAANGANSFSVSDSGLIFKDRTRDETAAGNAITVTDVNTVEFKAGTQAVVLNGGVVFTESVTSKTTNSVTTYTNKLNVEGSVSAAFTDRTSTENVAVAECADMNVDGDKAVTVTGALTLGANVEMNNAGNLEVSGTVTNTATGAQIIQNTGEITVTGLITASKEIVGTGVINAAKYTITSGTPAVTTYNYSTLEAAVPAVADAANTATKTILVMGEITVEQDLDVPAGITINHAKDAKLTIDRDATVTMQAGSKMTSAKEQVVVDGTLTFNDKTNDATTKTVSDVTVEDEAKNGYRTYTNIYAALAEATDGQTVTVTKDTGLVVIDENLTVPEGVTLVVPSRAVSLYLEDGVTLTVDGTLKTDLAIFAEHTFGTTATNVEAATGVTAKQSSAIVVNGTLQVAEEIGFAYGNNSGTVTTVSDGYTGVSIADDAPIYGAYYSVNGYTVVSTLAIAAGNADIVGAVVVNGPVNAGDVTFTGTDEFTGIVIGNNATVKDMNGKDVVTVLTVGSLTLVGTDVATTNGALNGDVVVGDARLTVSNVKNLTVTDDEEDGMVVSGNVSVIGDNGGKVTLAAGTATATLNSNNAADKFVEFDVAAGATLVSDGANLYKLTVDGTVSVASGKNLTAATVVVEGNGTLSVTASTATSAAGSAQIVNLFLGIDNGDYQTGDKLDTAAEGTATVSGPVSGINNAYVLNGAVIDESNLEGMDSTAFNVNGQVWFTAYVSAASETKNIKVDKAPVENAVLAGWSETADGEAETDIDDKDMTVTKWTFAIGTDAENLYAVIEYEIYHIVLKANEAVDDVFINGNLMSKGLVMDSTGMYYAYTMDIAAGSYTVSYTLANGYSGEGVLAVNGTAQSGLTFSVSGTPSIGQSYITYNMELSGFEKTGYVPESPDTGSDDSGMGITDYLLIVLVVLIVVMAIIVAMRLMRS